MSIALLATGDELVIGDTLNTNTAHIAQRLRSESLIPGLHLICGDDEVVILNSMRFLCEHHPTVIVTGGLGPTSDDRTRDALSRLIEQPLVAFPDALLHIETRLAKLNLSINPENRQQALFPASAELLPNPNGTAMGCSVIWENHHLFLLPGPPHECLPMFENHVIPILRKTQERTHLITRKWLLYGVAEGHIAEKFEQVLKDIDCQTGYRLDMPYLEFKVHCNPELCHQVDRLINPIAAPHMITHNHQKASALLSDYINTHQIPITIIDQLTGGQLQKEIQKPANYPYLSFYPQDGSRSLVFKITGLEDYWQKKSDKGETRAVITCTQDQTILYHEDALMPFYYRNHPLILLFAMEWICAKILEILKAVQIPQ